LTNEPKHFTTGARRKDLSPRGARGFTEEKPFTTGARGFTEEKPFTTGDTGFHGGEALYHGKH